MDQYSKAHALVGAKIGNSLARFGISTEYERSFPVPEIGMPSRNEAPSWIEPCLLDEAGSPLSMARLERLRGWDPS